MALGVGDYLKRRDRRERRERAFFLGVDGVPGADGVDGVSSMCQSLHLLSLKNTECVAASLSSSLSSSWPVANIILVANNRRHMRLPDHDRSRSNIWGILAF
jgi:hypothetical protein